MRKRENNFEGDTRGEEYLVFERGRERMLLRVTGEKSVNILDGKSQRKNYYEQREWF